MRRADALGLMLGQELDVAAGAECPACTSNDADINVRIALHVEPAAAQFDIGVAVQRVQAVRPVDGDISDVALFFVEHVLKIIGGDGGVVGRFITWHGGSCGWVLARSVGFDQQQAVDRREAVGGQLDRVDFEGEMGPWGAGH